MHDSSCNVKGKMRCLWNVLFLYGSKSHTGYLVTNEKFIKDIVYKKKKEEKNGKKT